MRIGIDLGGSHIGIGLVDNGKLVKKIEHNFSEQDKQNLEAKIREIVFTEIDNILKDVDESKIDFVGIATPGKPVNGYITNAYNLKLENFNIENLVKEKLSVEVVAKNDGICAGIAEKEIGSLKDCRNGIFLGLGTGIGMATFINGELVEDVCEVGHTIIEKDGRKCTCGRTGCFEAYCSMKVLKTQLRQRLQKENLPSRQLLEELEDEKTLLEVQDILDEYIHYLSLCIANLTRLCNTDIVVIGGSFVYFKDILLEKLINKIGEIVLLNEREKFVVKLATLKSDAGIIGATLIKNNKRILK